MSILDIPGTITKAVTHRIGISRVFTLMTILGWVFLSINPGNSALGSGDLVAIDPSQLSKEQLRNWPFGVTLEPSARLWEGAVHEPTLGGWYAIPPAEIERQCQLLKDVGAFYVRIEFVWPYIEPAQKGRFDWTRTDLIVETAGKYGLILLPQVVWTPAWAGQKPDRPPYNGQDYADFMTELVRRYGKGINHWEMWNEANLQRYWNGPVEEYVQKVLIPGYKAVKQVDPEALVLLAGTSGPDRKWLSEIYALGGKPYFDVVGVHQYSERSGPILSAVMETRKVMAENGDAGKQLWLTEFGYKTDQGKLRFFTEILQAYTIGQVMRKASPKTADKVFVYELKDNFHFDNANGKKVEDPERYGLVREDYSLKESFKIHKKMALDYARVAK